MAEYTPRMKTSDTSCNSSLMLVAFRLGYLQATCNQILAKVVAMQGQQTAPPPKSGLPILSRWRAWAADFVLLHKLLVTMRVVGWSGAALTLWAWLGWLVKVLVGR